MGMSRDEYQAVMDGINQRSMEIFMRSDFTIADRLEELAATQGDKPLLLWGDSEISYAQMNARADEYARVALQHGIRCGDCAAMMFENRPEFFYAWFGLLKTGATVALLNTQARGQALEHALQLVDAQMVFVGAECAGLYRSAEGPCRELPAVLVPDPELQTEPETQGFTPWEEALEAAHQTVCTPDCRQGLSTMDTACYIYTSGTTGHPKAARMSQGKWLSTGYRWIGMAGVSARDVFYCVLPLYHGAALMSLFSTVLAVGGPMALRRKFSARNFWKDVARYRVSVVQYIGEMCRYLVNTAPVPEEKNHGLRCMFGAGMGLDVWRRFTKRFGTEVRIYEGWGATESNAGYTNLDNTPGSCGRISSWEQVPVRIVRYDVEHDVYPRDENGFLQLADANEPGEIISKVHGADGTVISPFEGYSDPQASEKKLLRDVFEKGDCWFHSGDILRCDAEGYLYFVDRMGDTFRWKSENVSTTEVEQQLSAYEDIEIINVYGVNVPGHEGRCGMAALLLKAGREFDPDAFYAVVCEQLPHYAQPQFVRICPEMDMTGTYKLRKVDLQRQGYDPGQFEDALYVLNPAAGRYVPYSEDALQVLGFAPAASA